METAVSTVHHNHCASSVALKRLNLLTAAAQTLHLPHCVTDRVQLRSLAAHWKLRPLSCAYSAQRSQLNRPKCSLFGGVQMQRLFSMFFLRIWNTFSFHKHHQCSESKDVVESQRFAQLWYQASGLRYRPIWTVTHESESAVIFFNSNRIPETRTARFNEYAFQKQKWVNEHNQSKLVQVLLSSSKVETPTRCSSFRLIRDWQGSE